MAATFVADAMLGRLAKWMRFLGYDVLYFRDIDDRVLVRTVRSRNRVLLTRDRKLPVDFKLRCLLVNSERLDEQLIEVLSEFPPSRYAPRRCMRCNIPFEPVDRHGVKDFVPEYIYMHHDLFLRCSGCDRIYWEGTHIKNIVRKIAMIDHGVAKLQEPG